MILVVLLFGCGSRTDPLDQALQPWPEEPAALMKVCDDQPFPELATTCRVQAAARYAQRGDDEGAETACAKVPAGTWQEECHFRAGEELGRAGQTTAAMRHCAVAGWFARNCLTHAGWNLPPDPELSSATDPKKLQSAADEILGGVDQALAGAEQGVGGEGRDIVMARFGYNTYVGTGRANPAPAKLDGPLGVVLRTGFGVEAARLLAAPTVEQILAIWKGEAPVPTGSALDPHERMGRYAPPMPAPSEQNLARVAVYGGGMRLVGETPEEDVTIAALEGLFWRTDTDAAVFLPWVDDPRPRVRWTAAKLLRLTPSSTIDLEATLKRLSTESPDEDVRWHMSDGLARRTWEPGRRRR